MDLRKLIVWLVISIVSVIALRYGLVAGADQYVYALRHEYFPYFAYRYDDFLLYLPLALLFVLKALGVRSRNGWKQLFVSVLFSFALMGIVVLSMKSLAGVLRPDGSDLLSFPSGHTATAFTAAGVFRKEFGFRRPWVGVAGYLPAVITGLSRQLNNRHWLSDVLAGAVIGTIIVEIGYYLAGLFFKGKKY